MAKSPTDRSIQRIADSVRYTEQEQRNLPRQGRTNSIVPFEICRFEMSRALAIPQNGLGTSVATKLHWLPSFTHVGADYGALWTPTFGVAAESWSGDFTHDDEEITVFDTLRTHSKMATVGDDVGAYGIAWKPHDGLTQTDYMDSVQFWEILSMQNPGDFVATLDHDLYFSSVWQTVTVFRPDGNEGHKTWDGYDPFGPAWSALHGGLKIIVYNLPADTDYMFSGDAGAVVYCRWNAREGRYYIVHQGPLDYSLCPEYGA